MKKTPRKCHLVKISFRSGEAVRIGFEKIANSYRKSIETIFKSVTNDNGSKMYYANPYYSYERGTNEKQNSLIRTFFLKGNFFDSVTDEQIVFARQWINNLPRKIFGYRFIFKNVLSHIAI